jgi:RNA polymerase sigma-70 factor (ECF subfamily)
MKSEMLAADALMNDSRRLDSDSFMDVLDPVLPDAYRLAYALLRSRDDAGDVVQQSALSAWQHRRSFRPGAPIRPWFLAIVANQCRRTVRNRWWSVLKRPDLSAVAEEPETTQGDETENLRHALRRLNERDRLVLVLRYYLDLPFDEVASTLRISPGAARVRAGRALARLRPLIDMREELASG